jgi:O-antigen ligase
MHQSIIPHRKARPGVASQRQLVTLAFFAAIGVASFTPGRLKLLVEVFGVPVLLHEGFIAATAAFVIIAAMFHRWRGAADARAVYWTYLLLFSYAALSMTWSSVASPDTEAMAWTLIMAASALCVAYAIVSHQRDGPDALLARVTGLLGVIAAIYAAQSFFDLGLRSGSNGEADPVFGIDRVRGPLFGAAIGGTILIPALSYAVQDILLGKHRKRNAFAAIALLIAALGTGSRATLLGLVVFVSVAGFGVRSLRQRLALLVVVLAIGGAGVGFVFSRASSERLTSLEDDTRAMTWASGIGGLARAGTLKKVLGLGYGSYWPWYLVDVRGEGNAQFADFIQHRPAGETLYHPHSTPLLLVVELGVPGLVAGVVLIAYLVRKRRALLRERRHVLLFAGLAGSAVTFATDLLVFKTPYVNLIWWTYVFGALSTGELPAEVDASAGGV